MHEAKPQSQGAVGASLPFGGSCKNLELSIGNQGLYRTGCSIYSSLSQGGISSCEADFKVDDKYMPDTASCL